MTEEPQFYITLALLTLGTVGMVLAIQLIGPKNDDK